MFSSDSHIQMKCKGQTGREAGTQNYRVFRVSKRYVPEDSQLPFL
jgi:hypothetical protein